MAKLSAYGRKEICRMEREIEGVRIQIAVMDDGNVLRKVLSKEWKQFDYVADKAIYIASMQKYGWRLVGGKKKSRP